MIPSTDFVETGRAPSLGTHPSKRLTRICGGNGARKGDEARQFMKETGHAPSLQYGKYNLIVMMTDKYLNKYRIPSARATWHDYNGGSYFVTICTAEKQHYFGEIVAGENPRMELSAIGKYAEEQLLNVSSHYPDADIPLFVIMPNHIHAIVYIDANDHVETGRAPSLTPTEQGRGFIEETGHEAMEETGNAPSLRARMGRISGQKGRLGVVIGGIKSAVMRFSNEKGEAFQWQTRYHEHIIRNERELNNIAAYINRNIINWVLDCLYTESPVGMK